MNLSKIAVGVAVSLCLVSNIALADTQKDNSKENLNSKPTLGTSSSSTMNKEDTPNTKPEGNENNLSLIDKAKNNFLESYKKNEDTINNLLDNAKNEIEKNIKPSGKVQPKVLPEHKITKGYDNSKDVEALWNERQKQIEWEKVWKKLPKEKQEILRKVYGYYYAYKNLKAASVSGEPTLSAAFYSFDLLNDDVNQALHDSKMNKESLATTQETIQKGLKGVTELVDQNKEHIKANKENIKANKDKIEKNIASIDANKAKIELNHKSIQDVKSQLNARLNNLNKDLRRGLATQSALTGLFQPYSVGKMNVTAAVGGYQSEKAIAVGSGYRFNDNFAAKVGLSKSLGGSAVSYNMGVNYEF
ncbi:YadA C-terminal domain-containing protein [Pasteurella canis]|uniref:Trimeric autotransporter adhesin YadA-like C-terminal membrane anchor domain-containing protein n=1 Tax=Pasteurella canis TaxID=753 RepID=A0ABQ4VH87_9PAST|nr:YadA C-terminal domain-containing protein [Pasteurella canis]GJH42715.1 hypothetical protein PA42_08890 [Pasteurella canis]